MNNHFLKLKLKKIISYYSDIVCLGYFDPDDRENAYKMMGYIYKYKSYPKTKFNLLTNDEQRLAHLEGFRSFIYKLFNQQKSIQDQQSFLKIFEKNCEFFMKHQPDNMINNYDYMKFKNTILLAHN